MYYNLLQSEKAKIRSSLLGNCEFLVSISLDDHIVRAKNFLHFVNERLVQYAGTAIDLAGIRCHDLDLYLSREKFEDPVHMAHSTADGFPALQIPRCLKEHSSL